jgi:hypothetical protein
LLFGSPHDTTRILPIQKLSFQLRHCPRLHEACQTSRPAAAHRASGVTVGNGNWGQSRRVQSCAESKGCGPAKVSIALKEARETTYWLRLLLATELAPSTLIEPLLQEAGELVAILTVTRRKLNTPG